MRLRAAGVGGAHGIGIALAAGIGAFFILEKLVLWRHCTPRSTQTTAPTTTTTTTATKPQHSWLLVGDSIHNALDGVIIAAAFLTDTKLGHRHQRRHHGPRNPAGSRRLRRPPELRHVREAEPCSGISRPPSPQ